MFEALDKVVPKNIKANLRGNVPSLLENRFKRAGYIDKNAALNTHDLIRVLGSNIRYKYSTLVEILRGLDSLNGI